MKRHFLIKKINTIFQGSSSNYGCSPVAELNYGKWVSRILLKPEMKELVEMASKDGILERPELKHTLHMTNCGSVNSEDFNDGLLGADAMRRMRAGSFDAIVFRLPREFDQGTGSALFYDAFVETHLSYSENGSNWYQSSNGTPWKPNDDTDMGIEGLDDGVYSTEFLASEYDKFLNGKDSVVVAAQHFDKGFEDFDVDLTEDLNDAIRNIMEAAPSFIPDKDGGYIVRQDSNDKGYRPFYGYGIAFSPALEEKETDEGQYIGFFSGKTNTVFHPYIETSWDSQYDDDRTRVCKGKEIRLYLYCKDDGQPVDLDRNPKCHIDGIEDEKITVHHAGEGAYFARIEHIPDEWDNYSIHYDLWSDLSLNGLSIEEGYEGQFVVVPAQDVVSFSEERKPYYEVVPSVYGMKDGEEICRGDILEVGVMFQKKYSLGEMASIRSGEYRIRMKEGKSYITIFDYSPIDIMNGTYSFMLHASDLVPGKYYLDIRVKNGRSIRTYDNISYFVVINDKTRSYK